MPRTPFQQLLVHPLLQAQQLLSALSALNHVTYYNHNGKAFIACCSEEYWLAQGTRIQHFQESGLNQYIPTNADLNVSFNKENQATNDGFKGGYNGFVSYDYAASTQVKSAFKTQPSLFLAKCNTWLEATEQGWMFYSYRNDAKAVFEFIQNLIQQPQSTPQFQLNTPCTARWNQATYKQAFQQVQDYIVAGDCYQINLTQEFKANANGKLLATANAFWQLTNAPYAGYARVGEFELLSCSPELFIEFLEHRKMLTKPIKGTMPRYTDPILDEHSKQSLINSEKDMAENVMIVDLLRNDLSIYAETGTVKTPKLFNIESFNQVHHMVSEVEATLKAEVNPFDVLMSALPGGSITGAPKIRAMEIIDELEGSARGAYCGSMGYFNHNGTGSWNILIRSIQKYKNEVSLWAGGGITISSNADAEYQECFDKVEAMLDLLNTWYKPE